MTWKITAVLSTVRVVMVGSDILKQWICYLLCCPLSFYQILSQRVIAVWQFMDSSPRLKWAEKILPYFQLGGLLRLDEVHFNKTMKLLFTLFARCLFTRSCPKESSQSRSSQTLPPTRPPLQRRWLATRRPRWWAAGRTQRGATPLSTTTWSTRTGTFCVGFWGRSPVSRDTPIPAGIFSSWLAWLKRRSVLRMSSELPWRGVC